jgi:hypothetical protein
MALRAIPTGQPLHYRATDNLVDPQLRGLLPGDMIDIVAEASLHNDPVSLRSSLFHLLGCLSGFGKLGMTCVATSPTKADQVYWATKAALLAAAMGLSSR